MKPIRTRGRIRREAADWLARLGGGADAGNHAAFRSWYESSPRHAEAYDRLAAIWSVAGQLPVEVSGRNSAAADRSRMPHLGAIAACLVAGIALVLALMLGMRWLSDPGTPLQSFATAIGEIRQIALPDGSRLMLDSTSRVEVQFSSSERLLLLREGRARFFVAHEDRPFVVRAAASDVIATGTTFDVSLIEDRMAVLMLDGSVEVRRRGSSERAIHRLSAGQKLVITGPGPAVSGPAGRGETLWPSRMLEFDDVPLREAIALVNRYSRTQLRLADGRIGSLRVSGGYRAGDIAGFARSVAVAFGLRVETRPDGSLMLVESVDR